MATHPRRPSTRWKEGAVVRVPLGSGREGFARLLKLPLVAVYDLVSSQVPPIDVIVAAPVLFKVWVMRRAVTAGVWPKIGWVELPKEMLESPWFAKQDPISGRLTRYREAVEEPATFAELAGLERAAVWDPEHVVERLVDHINGRTNKFVESLRLKGS